MMLSKKSLLQCKKRLLALMLAGACTFCLAGCGKKQESSSSTAAEENSESVTQAGKTAVVILYEDRAVVIYCSQVVIDASGVYYLNPYLTEDRPGLYKTTKYTDVIPITDETYVCSTITPEELIAAAKGENFPITYLSTSSETLEEEGPKLIK